MDTRIIVRENHHPYAPKKDDSTRDLENLRIVFSTSLIAVGIVHLHHGNTFRSCLEYVKILSYGGGNYFDLPPTRGVIVWDKMQPWENFSQIEYAWTSFDRPASLFQYRSTNEKNKIHPTQKPIALYEWILSRYAKQGDIILDTHVGSASSLIACHRTNHKFVGFEIDEYYYDMAKKRLDSEMAQMNIFEYMEGK